MEHQLWKLIVAVLGSLNKRHGPPRYRFSDQDIVKVYYWSVICDRPTAWACQRRNWPLHLRQRPLPSPATMSRRLRSQSVMSLLEKMEQRLAYDLDYLRRWSLWLDVKPICQTVWKTVSDKNAY